MLIPPYPKLTLHYLACQHDGRALLADHDRRGLGVAADEPGHDRRIDDAQAIESAHAQLRIDHSHIVAPHFA